MKGPNIRATNATRLAAIVLERISAIMVASKSRYTRCALPDYRHGKGRVIQDIKKLCPEPHVEVLRDALDVVVLEHPKVQILMSRPDRDIAAGIASKVETLRESAEGRVAIRRVEGRGRCRRDREVLSLDVVVRISRMDKR